MSLSKIVYPKLGNPPFTTIGLFTFLRTYARRHKDDDPKSTIESWDETIQRVVNACNTQLKVGFTETECKELYTLLYRLKCSVAGRFLWQLGTGTVERLGLPSLQNCSFTVIDEPIRPFTWCMNFLMLGSGVGYRLLPSDTEKLPEIKYALITRKDSKDADFIVPDSREGWVKLLAKVLKAHFYSGKGFTYSCINLRSKGAPIKTFGGIASGPDILCDGMEKISGVLNKRAGQKARPIDCLDIMNIIGMIVVSGNVRRSAQLAIGDCRDKEFLNAKNWALGNIPNWRAYSNNSVVCNDIKDIMDNEDFWRGYDGTSEPYGLINLKLSRECGRVGETEYPDPDVDGYNPCLSGDSLIAVADGRNYVKISQLAEEGKDVPVYSMDKETGEVSIQWGRNPRITGTGKKLVRVRFGHLHKGEYIDVTPNHKFKTKDGREVEAKDLKKGDSIPNFAKYVDEYVVVKMGNGKRQVEHRLIKKFYNPEEFSEVCEEDEYTGCCKTDGIIVHHRDGNKTNNHIDNLEFISPSDHSIHHGSEMVGDKNPMFGKIHKEETKKIIGDKSKQRWQDPEFKEKMLTMLRSEKMREQSRINLQNAKYNIDTERVEDIEQKCVEAGLISVRLSDTVVRIAKNCETCGDEFYTTWNNRERAYCSGSCANSKPESVQARTMGLRNVNNEKAKDNFHKQVMIYKDLQEQYGENTVLYKHWAEECKSQGVSFRFQTNTPNPYICRNWSDFKQRANEYNHRVLSVEQLPGEHTVYNITVEKNHTFAVVTKLGNTSSDLQGVFSLNCGEQSLCRAESCCLGELYLPNITSKEELYKCVEYLYRICKHSLTLPCKDSEETERIVHKNMRMGIGVTGYLQATEEQRCWLPECYKYIREFDKLYSQQHGFPTSIKIGTCKPSGSLSLLGNTTPGIHPGFARYYLRRIRISSESQLIKIAKEHGYPVEYSKNFDGTFDHNTQIITFPHKLPDDTVLAENCSAVDQLNWVKRLQRDWSDNSVSVTVYYRKHELPQIKEWLKENYNTNIKTVSFLLHSDHGFIQAPMEQITKEEYEKLASQCKPITDLNGICYVEDNLEADCAGSACPLR